MSAAFATIRRFALDRRGNLTVVFALACLPLMSAVGCAVDYARATQVKAKLQAAADAATLGAIARNAMAPRIAAVMNNDGPIQPGAIEALQIFSANLSGVTGFTLENLAPEVACQEVLAGQVGVRLFALQHAPGEDVLFPAHSPPERPGQRSSGQVPLSDRRHS